MPHAMCAFCGGTTCTCFDTDKEYEPMPAPARDRRTYVGELEWALEQANVVNHDQNPNRAAQLGAALKYGLAVAIARRSKEPIPPRPNIKEAR